MNHPPREYTNIALRWPKSPQYCHLRPCDSVTLSHPTRSHPDRIPHQSISPEIKMSANYRRLPHTDTHIHTHTHMHTETDTLSHTHAHRHPNWLTSTQTNRHTHTHPNCLTNTLTYSLTLTYTHTPTHTHPHLHSQNDSPAHKINHLDTDSHANFGYRSGGQCILYTSPYSFKMDSSPAIWNPVATRFDHFIQSQANSWSFYTGTTPSTVLL